MSKLLTVCFVFTACFSYSFAQAQSECKVDKDLGGKFKIVDSRVVEIEGRKTLSLMVKLKPEKISKVNLIKVARRIKQSYCNEQKINAIILDSLMMKEKFDDLNPLPLLPYATKALYGLDRAKGEEVIEFVTNDGKLIEKIEIKEQTR